MHLEWGEEAQAKHQADQRTELQPSNSSALAAVAKAYNAQTLFELRSLPKTSADAFSGELNCLVAGRVERFIQFGVQVPLQGPKPQAGAA